VEAGETDFKTSHNGSRSWVRGNPPENRPPCNRGEPAIKRRLSKEQIAVMAAVHSTGIIFEARINGLGDIRPLLRDWIEPGSIICSDGVCTDGVRTYVGLAIDTASEPPSNLDICAQIKGQEAQRRAAAAKRMPRTGTSECPSRGDGDLCKSHRARGLSRQKASFLQCGQSQLFLSNTCDVRDFWTPR